MADATPKISKPFIVIAAVGLIVIVAFLGMKVLGGGGGGGGTDSATDSAASSALPGAPTATTTTAAPGEPSTPNQSFDVFTTKNPFQPLVTASADVGGSTTQPTSPPVDNSDGGVVPPPIIPAEQAPSAGTPVSVLEVSNATGTTVARVQVGSTVYTVVVGETFATSYRVVSLDPASGCGQFQYGDTPFELCVGQQTLK
jgi:hypothetical protein